jgi:cell division protein FtsQ
MAKRHIYAVFQSFTRWRTKMGKGKVLTLEDRIPKLKAQRKQKANRRLITYISFFFLLVIGIIYFQSPLNQIGEIHITGNQYVTEQIILDKLSLPNEAKFWTTDLDKLNAKLDSLQEIKSVQLIRMFPNDIAIKITEYGRVGFVEKEGNYFPILDNGKIFDSHASKATFINGPVLINWSDEESLQKMAKELKALPNAISNRISEIIYAPTDSEPYGLTLYMNDGNEVRATILNFAERMSYYPSFVEELEKLDSEKPMFINITLSGWAKSIDNEEKKEQEEENSTETSETSDVAEDTETTQDQSTSEEESAQNED